MPGGAGRQGDDLLLEFDSSRPGRDRRYVPSSWQIEREPRYRTQVRLEEGLRQTFDWYIRNPAWWRGIMDGSYQKWIEANYQGRWGAPVQ